ncbi:DUF2634 domain-containing protein [Gorillibacterium timonense]|uniref:DUF2634 domain-containing protein n=1 Tax=Gorillibacterium timonense TaxID=1689269 RepID=UPI00071CC055|nr:DUF2634 domain-containing protein [Gorillibacterium timonense]
MIPEGGNLTVGVVEESVEETSRTYRLDPVNGRIAGMIDGLEAVKQAAFKLLQTERFDFLIYDQAYGSEFRGLIGLPGVIAASELERLIREALLTDDRISDVQNIQVEHEVDETLVRFDVISTAGSFLMEKEVNELV